MIKNIFFFLISILALTPTVQAGGAAACFLQGKTDIGNPKDFGYVFHADPNLTETKSIPPAFQARSEAIIKYKKEFGEDAKTPKCINDANLNSGYIIIIKTTYNITSSDVTTFYGTGFGKTENEAEADAIKRMKNRWFWKKKYGYKIEELASF